MIVFDESTVLLVVWRCTEGLGFRLGDDGQGLLSSFVLCCFLESVVALMRLRSAWK